MIGADHALFEFMNRIKLKRAYEQPGTGDGFRILVERLWPRGLARDRARIDLCSPERRFRQADAFDIGGEGLRAYGRDIVLQLE